MLEGASLRQCVEGKGTVNLSTSVSVGSSPTAPISHLQLDSYRFSLEPNSHQLRKFYAVDANKLAQYPFFQSFRISKFKRFIFTHIDTILDASLLLLSIGILVVKKRQNFLQVRKNCVNLCLSTQIYSFYLEHFKIKQGINPPLLCFILLFATLHLSILETYGINS